ncbi:MAG: Crp/Fnr family transcriptional regulator [Peptostreptococcaceae bacterium]|nr:Crp/Fnr family transcriptional regulator [Peptostreptococcaceae bacterium]
MKKMCSEYLCTSKIALFCELDESEQQKIATSAEHFEKEPMQVVVRENERADYILIIREGKVKLNTFDMEGKEYILNVKVNSHIIGEEYLLKNTVFDYNVETIEHTKFCKISTDILFEKAMENPLFAKKMILSLSKELQEANNKIRLMMESDALRRICGFLLYQSRLIAREEIALSLDDISAIINLRKETVSRKCKQLEQRGIIQRAGHKKIRICRRDELEKIFYEI